MLSEFSVSGKQHSHLKSHPSMSGHLEGRGRATPIFLAKIKVGIFFKFLLHQRFFPFLLKFEVA